MNASPLRVLFVGDDEGDRGSVRRIGDALGWSLLETISLGELGAKSAARRGTATAPLDDGKTGATAPAGTLLSSPNDSGSAELACVLLASNRPGADALAALSRVRDAWTHVPVVMLVGTEDEGDDGALRFLTAGASDCLAKRLLSQERLAPIVTRVTEARRAQDALRRIEERLAVQEQLLGALAADSTSGVLVTDGAGNVVIRNAKWTELIGEEWGGLPTLADLARRAAAAPVTASAGRAGLARAVSAKDAPVSAEDFRWPSPNGSDIVVRLRRTDLPAADGATAARVAMLDDVTRLRATEEYQQQVMSIVSHDLRNPLSAITMNAALLARGEAMADERRTKTAGRIITSAARMDGMIDDLFDFTLAALGKGIPVRPRDTDLAILAEQAVTEARTAHPERPLKLHRAGDLRGHWDTERIQQVLRNLLGHALKHGDPGRPVVMACDEITTATVQGVELRIESHGAPISDDVLPQLFDAYRRGPGAARQSHGLELFIARRVVDAHRGTIAVTSSTSDGTRFTVRIPKHVPGLGGAAPEPSVRDGGPQPAKPKS